LIEVAPHVCEIGDRDLPLCGNAMPGRTPIHVSLQRKLLVVAILDQHLPQALGRYAGRKPLGSAQDGLTAPRSSSSLFSRSTAHHFRRSRRRYPSREGHRRIQPGARSAVLGGCSCMAQAMRGDDWFRRHRVGAGRSRRRTIRVVLCDGRALSLRWPPGTCPNPRDRRHPAGACRAPSTRRG
jgi:hypothetical protein